MKIETREASQRTPTLAGHRPPLWQHPAYLKIWERMPYALQVRLMEVEGRLDRMFRRRLNVKRRNLHTLQRAVLIALIGAAARTLVHLLQTRH